MIFYFSVLIFFQSGTKLMFSFHHTRFSFLWLKTYHYKIAGWKATCLSALADRVSSAEYQDTSLFRVFVCLVARFSLLEKWLWAVTTMWSSVQYVNAPRLAFQKIQGIQLLVFIECSKNSIMKRCVLLDQII